MLKTLKKLPISTTVLVVDSVVLMGILTVGIIKIDLRENEA